VQAVSGDESKCRMAAVNSDKSIEYKIMNAPSAFRGEPKPSRGNEPWRGHTWRFE